MVCKLTIRKPGAATTRAAGKRSRGETCFRRDVRGVASIEMALIFPMMLILFVGLVDASNLLTANRRVTLTASTLGDLVTQTPGEIEPAEMEGFFAAAGSIMDPFPAPDIIMEFYTYDEPGSTAYDWSYSKNGTCGAPPGDDAFVLSEMEKLMAEDNDVVVSRVCYNWEPVLGIILGFTTSTIQDQIMMRPRQTARIVCSDC